MHKQFELLTLEMSVTITGGIQPTGVVNKVLHNTNRFTLNLYTATRLLLNYTYFLKLLD